MSETPTPLVAGNWKMYGLRRAADEVAALTQRLAGAHRCQVAICPPATLLAVLADRFRDTEILWGGQDCDAEAEGAHTGDISAEMLADAGARMVIVGHSERRRDHRETDAIVQAKAAAAHRAGLVAIVCLGETEAERDSGRTLEVVGRQLAQSLPAGAGAANTVIAYEPVWAIGTGRTPTLEQIGQVHAHLRTALTGRLSDGAGIRILYGGSVKPANAAEIFAVPDVDGGLIGGASLKAADFWAVISAYGTAS
jgi:triosephosphate isomerase